MNAAPASGQTAVEDSVVNRPRPEYDPQGFSPGMALNMGHEPVRGRGVAGMLDTFVAFPSVGVELLHTDNVFETQGARVGDSALEFTPALELRSDWESHAMTIGFRADATRFFRRHLANTTDYELYATGKIEIATTHTLDLRASHAELHETNSILTDNLGRVFISNTSQPPTYAVDHVRAEWAYQADRFLLRADAEPRHLDFDNTPQANASPIIQSPRNRWEYDGHLRAGYEAFEGTVLYVEPGISLRRYDNGPADFPQLAGRVEDRNSDGAQVLAGLTYNASAVTYLDFGVGYVERDYRNPNLPNVSGIAARGAMTWNPTDFITVGLGLRREVDEATTFGVAGFFRTAVSSSLDYEYDYNKIVQATLEYAHDQSINRPGFTENINDFRVGLTGVYLINEYAKAKIGYRYEDLTSTVSQQSFRESQVFIHLDMFY